MENKANPFFKKRIMTAGPTPIPDFVHSAMSSAMYYHRSPDFAEVVGECRKLLPQLFSTKQEVLILSGSGTLAMEGSIANFLNPGDEVIAINSGKFGERWAQQAKVYGCKVHELVVDRGSAVELADVEKIAKANPGIKAILSHASETSTGVRHDVKGISKIAHSLDDCLSMVDAITAVGVFKVPMDEWGIDVMCGGSQKGLMLPPGLSFGAASERAWKRSESIENVRYYMDWRKEKKAIEKNTGAFTSPVTLIAGLQAVLRYFADVSFENVYKRNWQMCMATRAAALAMGFELLVQEASQASAACTAIKIEGAVPKILRERFNLTLSGGQDELKGKILRVGHLGYIDGWDVATALMAFAEAALDLGYKVDLTKGLEAFWKVMNSTDDFTPEDLRA